MIKEEYKECSDCNSMKHLDEYYIRNGWKENRCRACQTVYVNLHRFIGKEKEKTGKCVMCGSTEAKRTEWALIKGKEYSKDLNNYMELCVSCHRKYDYTEKARESITKRQTGIKGKDHCNSKKVIRIDIKTGERMEFECILDATKSLSLKSQSSISNVLSGIAYTAGGYYWEYYKQQKN